jgi:T4-like virus tail tube protein gp19
MKTRSFILVAVAVFAALVGGFVYVALSGGGGERRTGALAPQSSTAGNFTLMLDGANVGQLRSVSGCEVSFEAVQKSGSADSGAAYRPCTLAFNLGMEPAFLTWVSGAVAGNGQPKDVSILQSNATGNVVAELRLSNAQITSFTMPALAGGSNTAVFFEATVEGQVQKLKGSGKVGSSLASKTQKNLLASNFKLTIPGLEQDLAKTNVVDGWSINIKNASNPQPGELAFTVGEPVNDLDMWLDNLMKGANSPPRPAKLELLDASLKSALVELNFTSATVAEADLLGTAESPTAPVRRNVSLEVGGASLKFN